jgi:hypothetical protein
MLEKNLFSQLDRLIDHLKDLVEAMFVTVFLLAVLLFEIES